MKHLINIIIGVATVVCIVCFAIAYAAPHISPDRFALPVYFGMAYPFLIIGTAIFIPIWLLRRKYIVALELTILLAVTFPNWRTTFVINKPEKSAINSKKITILTYNVMLFDFQEQIDNILDYIERSDADVVALQEFGYYFKGNDKDRLLSRLKSLYPYRQAAYKIKNKRYCMGVALFSRYPIINGSNIKYESAYNLSVYSDIVVDGDTLRLINNHLESNKLNTNDRKLAQLLRDEPTGDNFAKVSKDVSEKIGTAAKKRAVQAHAVRSAIDSSPHPVIVVGDFNDVPQSYAYHIIGQNLNDAYALAGKWGYDWSFNRDGLLFRIDHILTDKTITPVKAEIEKVNYSDHYPLKATLIIK